MPKHLENLISVLTVDNLQRGYRCKINTIQFKLTWPLSLKTFKKQV